MSNITKLNWNEQDGTLADVNDIKPIADKIDDVIDVVNPLDDEVQTARGTYSSLDDRLDAMDTADSELDTRVTNLEIEVTNARGTFSDLDSRLDDVDARISSNDNDISNIQNEIETARGSYSDLNARFDADEQAIDLNTAHRNTTSGNPHQVTKAEVGLGDVTNDAQLKRAGNDFATFTEKTVPKSNDIVLIEDSENGYAKKKLKMQNMALTGAGTDLNAVHVNSNNEINGITEKISPDDNDIIILEDNEDSYNKKKLRLSNLSKISTLGCMTKQEFEALAALRREKYAGSGFIEWGSDNSNSAYNINHGMTAFGSVGQHGKLALGPGQISLVGISKTKYPIVNINGYKQFLRYINSTNGDLPAVISFPSPPTSLGTITDSTNLPFSMKQGDFAILNDTDRELVYNGTFDTGISGWHNYSNVTMEWDSSNQRLKFINDSSDGNYVSVSLRLIKGVRYKLVFECEISSGINFVARLYHTGNLLTVTESGTYEVEFVAVNKTDSLYFHLGVPNDGNTAYIDNVSIKQVSPQPIVALQDISSGIDIYQNSDKFVARDSISRQDLVFLESWHEDVSEKDVVYPYGNVQYRGSDVDGLSGIADANWFTGYDTYSLFGNWQNAGDLVGKGYRWSQLSESDKQKLMKNPEHNLYIDGDKVIQVRYRIRVVKGLGNKWDNISRLNNLHDQFNYGPSSSIEHLIRPKGKLVYNTDITNLIGWNLEEGHFRATSKTLYAKNELGIWAAQFESSLNFNISYNAQCFALPICTVQRRNSGAYSPVYNPEGCAKFLNTDGTTAAYWYETDQTVTPIDCFDSSKITGGTISSGISGRPDGLYADEVNERDVKDLRMSAHERPWEEVHDDYRNKAIAGEIRGEEKLVHVKVIYKVRLSSTYGDIALYDNNSKQLTCKFNGYNIGLLYKNHKGMTYYRYVNGYVIFNRYNSSVEGGIYNDIAAEYGTDTLVTLNSPLIVFDRAGNINYFNKSYTYNNTMTWCDIIGDPRKLSDRVKYTNDGTSQTVTVNKNDYVYNNDGDNTNGLTGHYYRALNDRGSIDLSTEDFSNTSNWIDLGDDGDIGGYPQEWLDNGIAGVSLIVGENGESLLPVDKGIVTDGRGCTNAIKLSRKSLEASVYKVLVSKKDGSWQEYLHGYEANANAYSINTTSNVIFVNITNSYSALGYSSEQEMLDLMKVLVFYETKANFLELGSCQNSQYHVSQQVLHLGKPFVSASWYQWYGNILIQNLINKVSTNGDGDIYVPLNYDFDKLNIQNYSNYNNPYLSDWDDNVIKTTDPAINTTYSGPTVKAFTFLTKHNNRAYLYFVFKELKYDSDSSSWGDDNKFQIVDKGSTTTDTNSNVVLIGQKRCKIPYFIVDKD